MPFYRAAQAKISLTVSVADDNIPAAGSSFAGGHLEPVTTYSSPGSSVGSSTPLRTARRPPWPAFPLSNSAASTRPSSQVPSPLGQSPLSSSASSPSNAVRPANDGGPNALALPETSLLLPGQDSYIAFLGPHGDMPFLMVRANPPDHLKTPVRPFSVDSPLTRRRARGLSQSPQRKALPLAIHLTLAPSSFLPCGIRDEGPSLPRAHRQDLHVSIFYNGEFVAADLITVRQALGGDIDIAEIKHVYTGRRVGRQFQRKFLYFTSACNEHALDPFSAKQKAKGVEKATSRWHSIGESLSQESKGWCNDTTGMSMPTGQFVKCLSELPMPSIVESMASATPDSHDFGVIDIVVALGRGRKLNSSYPSLVQPSKIVDPDVMSTPSINEAEISILENQASDRPSDVTQVQMREGRTRSASTQLEAVNISDETLATPSTSKVSNEHLPQPSGRPSLKIHLKFPTNMLKKEALPVPGTANANDKPSASKPQSPNKRTGDQNPSGRASKLLKASPKNVSKSNTPAPETSKMDNSPPSFLDPSIPATKQLPKPRQRIRAGQSQEKLLSPWEPSALNSGSTLSFAGWEADKWQDGNLHHMRTERLGYFSESSILMGVRFIVG